MLFGQIPGADQVFSAAAGRSWEAVLLTVLILGGLTVVSTCMWKLTNLLGAAAREYITAHVLANGQMASSVEAINREAKESAILLARALTIQEEGVEAHKVLLVVLKAGVDQDKLAHDEALGLLRKLVEKA